jgi:RNA polymerase sigma factor (sigma-70 family)
MQSGEMTGIVDRLRGLALHPDGAPTDGQLLEAYVARRDGGSFEALVHRHAAMVLGVCRRIAGNSHDADDAFQATFLVLVRKARSVVPREQVGNWLYGVAYRTALKARSVAGRRRLRERPMTEAPPSRTPSKPAELLDLLDHELERLPAKYRLPIVLCDLECRTRREAARQLGLPTGTLSGRLTTAHRLLALRLARRGVAVAGPALAAALAAQAEAGVPGDVVSSILKAAPFFAAGSAAAAGIVPSKAVALAEGVLRTMLLTKLKLALAVLASVFIVGAGVLAYEDPGATPGPGAGQAPAKAKAKRGAPDMEQARAEIEAAQEKMRLEEARVMQAQATLEQARAQLDAATLQLERAQADYKVLRARVVKDLIAPAGSTEKPRPGRASLEVRGYLRSARVVQVTSSLPGTVTGVHVQEGDVVKAGQLLASLDDAGFRTDVERARVGVELAQARLHEAKAGQSDEKIHQNTAVARVLIAEAELKRAEVELGQAKVQLEKTQLRAPIAGIVARRQVEVGDTVNPAQGPPSATRLFELIDPRSLLVAVSIGERDLAAVFPG